MDERSLDFEIPVTRDPWEQLLRESGLHYTRGHVPTDLPRPE